MSSIIFSISSPNDTTTLTVGTALVIKATVVDDANGNSPVDAENVSWVVTGATPATFSSVTNAAGEATISITASAVGSVNVKATTADDGTGKELNLTAVVAAEDTKLVELSTNVNALPNDIGYANAGYHALVTANVSDIITEAPAPGVAVTWTAEDDSGLDLMEFVTLKPVQTVTDPKGNASVEVTITKQFEGRGAPFNVVAKVLGKKDKSSLLINVIPFASLNAPAFVTGAHLEDDFTLDQYDIANGVDGIIRAATPNLLYRFYWDDQVREKTSSDSNESESLRFDINESFETPFTEGDHTVLYISSDAAGNPSYSQSITVLVRDAGLTTPSLPAPTIAAATADNIINAAEASAGISVVAEGFPILKDDLINLYWSVADKNGINITGANFSEAFLVTVDGVLKHTFKIPSDNFFPNGKGIEGLGRAFCTVVRAGATLLSEDNSPYVDTLAPKK